MSSERTKRLLEQQRQLNDEMDRRKKEYKQQQETQLQQVQQVQLAEEDAQLLADLDAKIAEGGKTFEELSKKYSVPSDFVPDDETIQKQLDETPKQKPKPKPKQKPKKQTKRKTKKTVQPTVEPVVEPTPIPLSLEMIAPTPKRKKYQQTDTHSVQHRPYRMDMFGNRYLQRREAKYQQTVHGNPFSYF